MRFRFREHDKLCESLLGKSAPVKAGLVGVYDPLAFFDWNVPGLATNSIFFCFHFVKKSLICLDGKSLTPQRGNTILFRSSQQLPRVRLGPLRGFLSCPRLTSCVASGTTEIQGHRQVYRARRGGPRTQSTSTDANLDCAFVENALLYIDP